MSQNCGLSVVSEGEFLLRPLPHYGREANIQSIVHRLEDLSGLGVPLRHILTHAHVLCTLPRAQYYKIYHLTAALAQVKPPPKATMRTTDPGLILPERTHSSSAIGMEPADVLP